jgi:hypothetical protein
MQLFGLHYHSIVDACDLQWFSWMLEHCKLLDMNDFLHNESPYVVSQVRPQYCAPSTVALQYAPSSGAPHVHFVESIFLSPIWRPCARDL